MVMSVDVDSLRMSCTFVKTVVMCATVTRVIATIYTG